MVAIDYECPICGARSYCADVEPDEDVIVEDEVCASCRIKQDMEWEY